MDKLQKNIRRVGGQLESPRRPHGDRLLLPAELELCNLLGLSREEYFEFVDITSAHNGERKEGYELIPDIRNEAVTALWAMEIGATTFGAIFTQVAVSVALGYLLSPKPKPIKAGANVRGADAIGSKKFAPQFEFNSLQELATLGDTVPLVFTNQIQVLNTSNVIGGIRVNGQLLWSQLLSLGRLQQLKAIALFSLGEIDGKPDFEGYAIGDLLLSTYSKKKLDLFFKSSEMNKFNRIQQGDRYTDSEVAGMPLPHTDVFSDIWPVGNSTTKSSQVYPFSGTRNPTTQAAFGLYSPMPNASVVKLPYELIYPQPKSSNEAKRAVVIKQKKIATFWPTRAGFTGGSVNVVGDEITYRVLKSNQEYDENYATGTSPHGIEDVISMIRSIREEVDSHITVGETYMAGDGLIACTAINNIGNEAEEGTPWRPTTEINGTEIYAGIERNYRFEVIEAGVDYGELFKHTNLYEHEKQPLWVNPADGGDSIEINGHSDKTIWTTQYMDDYSLQNGFPYRNPILQRVAIGTITNSRPCAMTEIGLKSKVFGSIRGANINGIPTKAALDEIYEQKVNFQLGQVDLYIKRLSFFKLQVRRAGTNGDWEDLNNQIQNDHSGLFCVKGNTPEFQYNYIKIHHPELGLTNNDQYEFRFKPYPGNNVALYYMNQKVNLLNANVSWNHEEKETRQVESDFLSNTTLGKFVIIFAGRDDFVLTFNEVSNTEWIQSFNTGTGEAGTGETDDESGGVAELSSVFKQGFSGIQYGPASPDPTPEYDYGTIYLGNGDVETTETLVSLNTEYPGDQWAYVAYEDGKEVGVSIVEAGTPATDVVIHSTEIIDTGLIVTDINGVPSAPQKPFVSNAIYTIPSDTPTVTTNPVTMGPVQYFEISKEIPTITLSVGVSEDSDYSGYNLSGN